MFEFDAIIVGTGPNGFGAAITLAHKGWRVLMLEGRDTIGGGMRTAELTLPGFHHDICSAIHPLGMSSPFFKSLPLKEFGLEWIHPTVPLAHPLDDEPAAVLYRDLARTAAGLGVDEGAYRLLFGPLVSRWEQLAREFLGPLRLPLYPLAMARLGVRAIWPTTTLAQTVFKSERAQALFGGLAAHSIMPLEWPLTSAIGLILGVLGHRVGWPLPRGGSQAIADALAAYFRRLGGVIETGHMVQRLADLPPARAYLLEITPRQLLEMAGDELPVGYRTLLEHYRYGAGVFKIDWALSEPIPWRDEACRRAGTVHVGGTLADMAVSESAVWNDQVAKRPYTLVAQQSLFDDTRAPDGRHTGWAYCHVPHGSTVDMTTAIENHIERFAPGFKDCILERHVMNTGDFERYNPNYVGGDINGGVQNWRQLFTRPVPRLNPYTTPLKNVFLCSASTPPGGGVHGMCGYHAAQAVLKRWR